MKWSCSGGALAALLLGLTAPALASEPHGAGTEGHTDDRQAHHRHHLGLFLGAAVREEEHRESGFALGLEYEYRPVPNLGLGALVEDAVGELRGLLVAAPLAIYPWRGLRLVAAPGAEIPEEGPAEFAMRLGIAYGIPVGRFSIYPEFNADLVEGKPTYVVGLTFGVGF
jgi:hypothetical protein